MRAFAAWIAFTMVITVISSASATADGVFGDGNGDGPTVTVDDPVITIATAGELPGRPGGGLAVDPCRYNRHRLRRGVRVWDGAGGLALDAFHRP